MISASEFRNGITVEYDGNVFVILDFQHVKPGKGAAFVRVKLKNLINGGTIETTFRPSEKMPRAHIDRKDMQFLYREGDLYNFMDVETYDQIVVEAKDVGDSLDFVKENEVVKILSYNGSVFGIEPPMFVELRVVETEPGFKGDTSTGAVKPAKLESGTSVNVPLFIDIDDVIQIDTRTGDYIKRV